MEPVQNAVANVAADNANVNNAGAENPRQPGRGESFMAITKSLILRALIIYFISSMFRKPQQPVDVAQSGGAPRFPATNLFANGTVVDLYVYVSENDKMPIFDRPSELVWNLPNIQYGDWYSGENMDGTFENEVEIEIPEAVQNNGSLYIHSILVRTGDSPNPSDKGHYNKKYTIHQRKKMNKFKKRRYSKTHNLLTGETTATEEEVLKAETIKEEIISHWHPNLTINIVYDNTAWVKGGVPSPIDQYIEFTPTGEYYKPIVFFNDYWNLAKDYQPFNTSVKTVPLRLTWKPLSMLKWQIYAAQSIKNQWAQGGPLGSLLYGEATPGEELDEDQDSLKEAMIDTNPYLLGVTLLVSVVHSVFEFLAFKNDIQFWRNRESLEGLSVRSVFFNVFQSLIVLLYVLDHETNTLIRISCFVGLGIEVWKIHKVVDVKVDRQNPYMGFIPIRFADKGSYVNSNTKEYDTLAFKYLRWALYPLLFGYAVYSLVYEEHKSWYSWVLSIMYGFLLTFGFIMMTPQLFINYKLKSVAHLPWRMMTYKALNTFIDDIFAFVIKMPTLYRLGCFRDDIIFFIFLYQRWIYRVDPSRVNEFGFSQQMLESRDLQPVQEGDAAEEVADEVQEQPKAIEDKKNE